MISEPVIRRFLSGAGVEVGGNGLTDIEVHDPRFYRDVLLRQSLGLGESYMRGWWSAKRVDLVISALLRNPEAAGWLKALQVPRRFLARFFNAQSLGRSRQVAEGHYDLRLDVFERMLDPEMVYTCAYWNGVETLAEAQRQKLDLVLQKIDLRPGMTLLDIGCGFGSLMKRAAEKYGARCVGYSVSEGQTALGRERCRGLPVEFVLEDYRKIRGKFDRIVSIGMLEAVGYKNFDAFFRVVHESLADDGVALIHTIGANLTTTAGDPWLTRYIFPNGMLPSIQQIGQRLEGRFVMEDWHNFGPDYHPTLLAWNANFQAAWPDLSRQYPEDFKRMWEYYLLSCAGGFHSRAWQLWQILLTRTGKGRPAVRQHERPAEMETPAREAGLRRVGESPRR